MDRKQLLNHAKTMRSHQTEAEQRLWYHLRAKRLMDLKFTRQKPIGPFIADFVCMEYKLVIEVDGSQHGAPADARRDTWFEANGFTLLRFWNNEILEHTDAVLEQIRLTIDALSPQGRGIGERGNWKEEIALLWGGGRETTLGKTLINFPVSANFLIPSRTAYSLHADAKHPSRDTAFGRRTNTLIDLFNHRTFPATLLKTDRSGMHCDNPIVH